MKNFMLFFSLLALVFSVSATNSEQKPLAENVNSSLQKHLLEVNNQWTWASSWIDKSELEQQTNFKSDNERIQTHLNLVIKALKDRTESKSNLQAFTKTALQKRTELLEVLSKYATQSIFPTYHYHAKRQPYFIDNFDVPCAVGHLIIESGNNSLAQELNSEFRYSYIKEMVHPDLPNWAKTNGFTIDELALIQPGYPPIRYVDGIGEGTDGEVRDIIECANGDILLAGDFEMAGGESRKGIASWDGFNYSSLGDGLNGSVELVLELANEDIVVGGTFLDNSGSTRHFARFNGSLWTYDNSFDGPVKAACIHNGELTVAGAFSGDVARFNASTSAWEFIGSNLNNEVLALSSFNGQLIAGGAFTADNFGSIPYIAYLDQNRWQPYGGGLDAKVRSLLEFEGQLIAAGDIYEDGSYFYGISAYDGTNWTQLIDSEYMVFMDELTYYSSVKSNGSDKLIIAGNFGAGGLSMTMANNLLVYTPDDGLMDYLSLLDAPVNAAIVSNGILYAGGNFTSANWSPGVNQTLTSNLEAMQIKVTLQLEGAYNSSTNLMDHKLKDQNLIPISQPYNIAPWNYTGTESFNQLADIPENAVDWVFVQVRNPNDINDIVAQRAGMLLDDGTVLDVISGRGLSFYEILPQSSFSPPAYHLSVHHRNHLDVVTANEIYLSGNEIDFSSSENFVQPAEQLIEVSPGVFALKAGDINADGVITVSDFNYYQTESSSLNNYLNSDCNLDRTVSVSDFNKYKRNAGIIGSSIIQNN